MIDDDRLAEIRARLEETRKHSFVLMSIHEDYLYQLGAVDTRWLLGQVKALMARVADRDHELIRVRAERDRLRAEQDVLRAALERTSGDLAETLWRGRPSKDENEATLNAAQAALGAAAPTAAERPGQGGRDAADQS